MPGNLDSIMERWRHRRKLTTDLLISLPDERLVSTVGKHMWMLGTQFRHLLRIQAQYMEAISVGRILPLNPQGSIPVQAERSVQQLLDLFSLYDRKLTLTVQEIPEQRVAEYAIDWTYWGESSPVLLAEHLRRLGDHEVLHHGQLAVYVRTFGLPFPKSWKTWNL